MGSFFKNVHTTLEIIFELKLPARIRHFALHRKDWASNEPRFIKAGLENLEFFWQNLYFFNTKGSTLGQRRKMNEWMSFWMCGFQCCITVSWSSQPAIRKQVVQGRGHGLWECWRQNTPHILEIRHWLQLSINGCLFSLQKAISQSKQPTQDCILSHFEPMVTPSMSILVRELSQHHFHWQMLTDCV